MIKDEIQSQKIFIKLRSVLDIQQEVERVKKNIATVSSREQKREWECRLFGIQYVMRELGLD